MTQRASSSLGNSADHIPADGVQGGFELEVRSPRRLVLAALGIAVLVALALFPWSVVLPWVRFTVGSHVHVQVADLRLVLQHAGAWGPIISILLFGSHAVIPYPPEVLMAANVVAWGPVGGLVISWIGSMLAAMLGYLLARGLGWRFLNRVLSDASARKFRAWSQIQGPWGLFMLRLIPFISFDILNYAAGLAGMDPWGYAWATGLGILPGLLLASLIGSHAHSQWSWIVAGGLVLIWAAVIIVRQRSEHSRLKPGRSDA